MPSSNINCLEHNQEIVAVCIEESCKAKTKAVCALELYNEHLDHKFENVTKMHSDWLLFRPEVESITSNITPSSLSSYITSLEEQILSKTKSHILALRKQLEEKLNLYYESKAVKKIQTGVKGIQKVLEKKYNSITHEEIDNAKFFIDVYGLKKLVNDTSTQKESFEKEIYISFSKLQEEMFMDYPKLNALVQAKEYEYCQIISAQKQELSELKKTIEEMKTGYEKMQEQHRQMSYEVMRISNELKNKEKALEESTERMKIITKKYEEQAKEAIAKAREIKTKNIFANKYNKHLHRVNERIVRTGHKELQYPAIMPIGEANEKLFLRVNRFDVGSWILIGVMSTKSLEKCEYEFDEYQELGHGAYMLDSNRWVYSDHDPNYNCKSLGFEFGQNDIVRVEIIGETIKFSKIVYGWEEEKFELPFKKKQNEELQFCVAIRGEHTEVQLV